MWPWLDSCASVFSHLRFSHSFEKRIIEDSLARFKVKDKATRERYVKKIDVFPVFPVLFGILVVLQ